MSKIVTVERCRNCQEHQWTTRHDPQRYDALFNELKLKLEQKGYLIVEQQQSRMGSFEIVYQGELVFSKFASGHFPEVDTIIKSIQTLPFKSETAPVKKDALSCKSTANNRKQTDPVQKPTIRVKKHKKQQTQCEAYHEPDSESKDQLRFSSDAKQMLRAIRLCRARAISQRLMSKEHPKTSDGLRISLKGTSKTPSLQPNTGVWTERHPTPSLRLKKIKGKFFESTYNRPYLQLLNAPISRRRELVNKYI